MQRDLAAAADRAATTPSGHCSGAAPELQPAQHVWFALSALAERFRGTISLAEERARNLADRPAETGAGPGPRRAGGGRRARRGRGAGRCRRPRWPPPRTCSGRRVEDRTQCRAGAARRGAASWRREPADRRPAGGAGPARRRGARRAVPAGRRCRRGGPARPSPSPRPGSGRRRPPPRSQIAAGVGRRPRLLRGRARRGAREPRPRGRGGARPGRRADRRAARRAQRGRPACGPASTRSRSAWTARTAPARCSPRPAQLPGVLGGVAAALQVVARLRDGHRGGARRDRRRGRGPRPCPDARRRCASVAGRRRWPRRACSCTARGTMPDRRQWPALPDRRAVGGRPASPPRTCCRRWPGRSTGWPSCASWPTAVDVVDTHPDVRAVTLDGDLIGPDWAVGGHAGAQSVLEIQCRGRPRGRRAGRGDWTDRRARGGAGGRVGETPAALDEADRRDAGRSCTSRTHGCRRSRRNSPGAASAVRESQARRSTGWSASARRPRRRPRRNAAAVADLEERLRARRSPRTRRTPSIRPAGRARRADGGRPAARGGRAARGAHRGGAAARRRRAAPSGCAGPPARSGRPGSGPGSCRRGGPGTPRSRRRWPASARRAAAPAGAVARGGGRRARPAAEACARRRSRPARRRALRVAELQAEWERLTDRVHAGEVVRAQQTLQAEQLAARALEEFAIAADELVAGYGPDVPVPATAQEMAEYQDAKERGEAVTEPQPSPYDRATQERRARRAERDLAALGKVNPLALEEFSALEERHAFLVHPARGPEGDAARPAGRHPGRRREDPASCSPTPTTTWPGSSARCSPRCSPAARASWCSPTRRTCWPPASRCNARPPGKKVRRLSLLSGGERSLTAVALLVAIFRARPSPFYVMDEVEAALDEVNLPRLVNLLTELRDSSQLIVITHQKFTMEAADALYGVSMRGDGITAGDQPADPGGARGRRPSSPARADAGELARRRLSPSARAPRPVRPARPRSDVREVLVERSLSARRAARPGHALSRREPGALAPNRPGTVTVGEESRRPRPDAHGPSIGAARWGSLSRM